MFIKINLAINYAQGDHKFLVNDGEIQTPSVRTHQLLPQTTDMSKKLVMQGFI
jgi:hypothetical protein